MRERQSPLDGTEFHALNICPDIEKVLEFEAEMWPFDPFGSTSIRHGRAPRFVWLRCGRKNMAPDNFQESFILP